jgi:hypothetical protein
MELVNPLSAFRWDKPLEMPGGVRLMGIREKQGHAFSRHGYLAWKTRRWTRTPTAA